MIPKIIHYCWFGKNPVPEDARKCIESWKKYCPDYEIIEWNEDNYDINKNRYMSDAYREKMWAFVSDYARIDVINKYGGIYMDTDVELIKPLDEYLNCDFFCGWEKRDPLMDKYHIQYENSVAFGLGFGSIAHHPVLKELLDLYEELSFYKEDGSYNLLACPHYQTMILKKHGLDDSKRTMQMFENIFVYPEDYFSPKSLMTGQIELTENTVSIHHFSMSWHDKKENDFIILRWKLTPIFGYKLAKLFVKILSLPYRLHQKWKR